MNKSNSRGANPKLGVSHGGTRTGCRELIPGAAATFTAFFVGLSIACYVIDPAEANPADTEPVIKVVKPYASSEEESSKAEAKDVLNVLQTMGKAYASGDIAEYVTHLDNYCSVFDEHKNQVVEGKEAVITALKQKFAKRSQAGAEHILSYTIDQPYVKVNGKTAVVTYRAIEAVGEPHPRKLEGFMSDVFEKEDGRWVKVHQRAVWKRIK